MAEEQREQHAAWSELSPEFVERLRAAPDDVDAWSALAEEAARSDRPEGLAALGRELLRDVAGARTADFAERVLRFHEEWFGDEAPAWLELIPLVASVDASLAEATVARLTMGLTDAERWDELFALYDVALRSLTEPELRLRLLEEAAQAAKDFARRPERAANYYGQLLELRPDDGRTRATLERLLQRLGRWEELTARWERSLPAPDNDAGLRERLRLAGALHEHLQRTEQALGLVLGEGVPWSDHDEAVGFLERVAGSEAAPRGARALAWRALAQHWAARSEAERAAEAFEAAAAVAEGEARREALRRWARWLAGEHRWLDALEVWARVLGEAATRGELDEEAFGAGAEAARQAGRLGAWAERLAEVAQATEGELASGLLSAAADTVEAEQPERALQWLQHVVSRSERPEPDLLERIAGLLDRLGRQEERLQVAETLARTLETSERRGRWVEIATSLAEQLGLLDRASALLREEAERHPDDDDRFERWVALLERSEQWASLAEALRWRLAHEATPPAARARLRDRLAAVLAGPLGDREGALALAEEALAEEPTAERVDRVATLLEQLGRHDRLEALWRGEAERLLSRFVSLRLRAAALRHDVGDAPGAAEQYAAVLAASPGQTDALEGLGALLQDEQARAVAARALFDDARRRGDRAAWLAVVPTLLQIESDEAARGALLRDALAAWETLGDAERAAWARSALGEWAERNGRWAEALEAVAGSLADRAEGEERVRSLLRAADLFTRLEASGNPESWLGEVLERVPGHREALERLEGRLGGQHRWEDLVALLEAQARTLEQAGDTERAADAWQRTAQLAEQRLGDAERTAQALRRLAALRPSAEVFERLASLAEARGEPGQAAHWLERWWREYPQAAAPSLAVRLADALRAAGRPERALEVLRTAFAERPGDEALRRALLLVVDDVEDAAARADVLLTVASSSSEEERANLAMRAAEAFEALGEAEGLLQALRLAAEERPEDTELGLRRAEAARAAGQLEEAETVARALLDRFGRRRTPARARTHRLLAEVAEARGELEEAQRQLEAASEVDRSDPHTLRALARLARKRGDMERAERVYRGLLLAVRRAKGKLPWTTSELMWELGELSRARGDEEEAAERVETAFAEAAGSDREAEHLARAALASGHPQEALRALETRFEAAEGAGDVALRLLRARVLDEGLGRSDEAFEQVLDALRSEPGHAEVATLARDLARRTGGAERLYDVLRRTAEAAGGERAQVCWRLAADVADRELGRADVALEAMRRAQALGPLGASDRLRLASLAAAGGDTELQRQVLSDLAQDEPTPADVRAEALRGLARLAAAAGDAEGTIARLQAAMALEPKPEADHAVLLEAAGRGAGGDAFDALYGEVARTLGQPDAWLGYLRWRAGRPDATVREVRQALEEAERQAQDEVVEGLLERLVEVAAAETDAETAREAMVALAARREAAGDLPGAAAWLERALEVTPSDDDEAFELRLRLAGVAGREGGEPERALAAYEELLGRDPTDERVWAPMLELLARLGDEDRLRERVEQVVESVLEPEARNRARMVLARFYLGQGTERIAESVAVLRQVTDEEPDHEEAIARLTELYEQGGYDDELAELLWRRLDAALDRDQSEEALALGMRLGALLASSRPADATDVYRRLIDSGIESAAMIERYLELVDPEDDPDLVLELSERLLVGEQGEAASARARWLADRYAERGDEEGRRRVLRLGLERAPRDEALAEALARAAADAGDHEALVALLLSKAERAVATDPETARAAFEEAATLRLERLGDVEGAAAVVGRARQLWPEDPELLALEVQLLRRAGRLEEAAERLGEALAGLPEGDSRRAALLRQRAEMAVERGAWEEALADLTEAMQLDPEGTAGARVRALAAWRRAASEAGDEAAERRATMGLFEALLEAGDGGQAHDVLADWTRAHPEDAEALARRRALEQEFGLHEALVETATLMLGGAKTDEARKEAAMLLADAATAAGRPESARKGLEAAVRAAPQDEELFARLLDLYEQAGAHREVGALMLERARAAEEASDEEGAFEALQRAGRSLVAAGEPEAATDALRRAAELRPGDVETAIGLADALSAWGQLGEAAHVLQGAIERHPRRRSPELGALQYAMARLARTAGDRSLEYQWLVAAFDADKQNLQVASELAELAIEMEEFEPAMRALRAVTMGKGEAPMSRARAYLLQARIAFRQGEGRRALLYARKAKSEDPTLPEVDELLRSLGG